MDNYCHYRSPFGWLRISERGGELTSISISDPCGAEAYGQTPVLQEAVRQLDEYFAGTRRSFDLPLATGGTGFRTKIWNALMDIPYGQTRTYKQIAECVGNPRACRAVGMANNRNPLMIVIPCHRVIGSNGKLVGYAGGLKVKDFLLRHEHNHL